MISASCVLFEYLVSHKKVENTGRYCRTREHLHAEVQLSCCLSPFHSIYTTNMAAVFSAAEDTPASL
jgi:hypothetical protein